MEENRLQDLSLLLLRLTFGSMMFFLHGLPKVQKLLAGGGEGFFDPFGLGGQVSMGLAAFAETLCSLLVVLGLFTRWALIPLLITMLMVVFWVKWSDPLAEKELALLYLIPFLAILLSGPGWFSLDRYFNRPY